MKRCIWTVLVTVCALALASLDTGGQENDWQRRFQEAWDGAQAAEQANHWEEALRLYREVQVLIPGESVSLVGEARCLGRLGRGPQALDRLAKAVESGWNQAETLRTEPAFQDIREHPDFTRLFGRIDEIEHQPILVYVPPGVDVNKPALLIVAFHGRSENPHCFLPTWKAAAEQLQAVVVAPRGVHRSANHLLNRWEAPENRHNTSEIDLPACQAIADQAIQLAGRGCTIDPKRIVLAGYSQGGAVALRLLGQHPERYLGAFAQATLYKDQGVEYWKEAKQKRSGRVVLIAGALDRLRPHSERAQQEMQSAGWTVRYDVIPDVGHEGPTDNVPWQISAIRFLLGDNTDGQRPTSR